jgi:hypothetical protein
MGSKVDSATVRDLVKAAGLTGVVVRKGRGCRTGAVHLFMGLDSTREERVAVAAWLASAGVASTWPADARPEFFDSCSIRALGV